MNEPEFAEILRKHGLKRAPRTAEYDGADYFQIFAAAIRETNKQFVIQLIRQSKKPRWILQFAYHMQNRLSPADKQVLAEAITENGDASWAVLFLQDVKNLNQETVNILKKKMARAA